MKYDIILRRLRQRVFDYPPHMDEKVSRVMEKVKARKIAAQNSQPRKTGPYSGLTRGELAKTGTCETDWF